MLNPFAKIFGSSNDRVIKKMMRHVNDANNLEKDLSEKPDAYFSNLNLNLKIFTTIAIKTYMQFFLWHLRQ